MTPEQEQAIADLRTRNVAPKQIARQLGLRPAEVSAVIKAQAEQATTARATAGELNPLLECLVNKNCLPDLLLTQTDRAIVPFEQTLDPDGGFAIVMVSRKAGFNRLEVCTYLVDTWCLGVKDATGPRKVDPVTYREFVEYAYRPYESGTEAISLELAQAIVFGGIDYAAQLGFQPHRDFAPAKPHLGEWSGQPKLNFGRNGKPFYANGPYDDPLKILKTLREHVGEGNFDYMIGDGERW